MCTTTVWEMVFWISGYATAECKKFKGGKG